MRLKMETGQKWPWEETDLGQIVFWTGAFLQSIFWIYSGSPCRGERKGREKKEEKGAFLSHQCLNVRMVH